MLFSFWLQSCNYTKHLTQNQRLLEENTVKLTADEPIKYKGEIESAILSLVNPQANTHLFDFGYLPKYKLWKYNNNYRVYQKDTLHKKILKRKVEKPVLLDTASVINSMGRVYQFMLNQGYFYATVDTVYKKGKDDKSVVVEYVINAGKRYTINDVSVVSPNTEVKNFILSDMKNSNLKKGEPFNNFKCGFEKDRIYQQMRAAGYYDFKSDNVSFVADTTDKIKLLKLLEDPFSESINYGKDSSKNVKENKVNVQIEITKTRDSSFLQKYYYESVTVDIYEMGDSAIDTTKSELEGILFTYTTLPVNRRVITRNIYLRPGEIYSPKDVEATINRLNQLGIFQNVSINFDKSSTTPGRLNAHILLRTSPKMDLEAKADISTSEDYFVGFGGSLLYRNKNLFFGANQFTIRGSGALEFRNDSLLDQKSRDFYYSGYNVGISLNLIMPKFITPFRQTTFNRKNKPYTILSSNYSIVNRRNLYSIINLAGSFGYNWTETQEKNWRLNPSFLTVSLVPERFLSSSFKAKIDSNSYLKNVFSNNIIYGENVTFEYRSKPKNIYKDYNTLRLSFEEAGTLLKGVNYLYNAISNNNIKPIAHYLRLEADGRHYTNRLKHQWVNRVMLGLGVPLGNDISLPYIKQYSSGGSFSLRGWQPRTVGPGRSVDTTFQSSAFIDRTGDIKFELNSELRFNLIKLFSGAINLKGAVFADAGNIWLFRKNETVKGGEFNVNYLFNDLALSTGLGARFDFSFFVFRLDVGYPIKQPSVTDNFGFVISQLNLRKSAVFNFGIGYPF